MPKIVKIKVWMIQHDEDGVVYYGPYFSEEEAKAHNYKNIHGWGKIYQETEEAILADDDA